MDLDGYLRRFVHICAMRDEWLRAGDAAERYGLSRNTPRNWFNEGVVRMRDGRFSRRDIERELDRKSTGRKPAKEALKGRFRDLSKREKDFARPFVEQHGLRKLRRLLWSLPFAAKELDWSAQKKRRYAQCLRDGADAIWPVALTAGESLAHGGLLEKRKRERKRLTDASHLRITKNTGGIIFQQVDPESDPGCEIVPFGIAKQDEQYVLLDARDPEDFLNRAEERGYEFPIEQTDPAVSRTDPFAEDHTRKHNRRQCYVYSMPDLAAEIDARMNETEAASEPDVLAQYRAITNPVQRECFRQQNLKAIREARMERAKPSNWEHLLNIAERVKSKKWKWIKIDDGYGFRAVPAKPR